ncbi:MAG TPA: hypothetical protein VLD57_01290, partial [Blastocatellia bacterium]|nr:hypothetical protein [Blastocatellia bacterium]
MRCIRCGYDSKYKERSSGQCPSCRKEFAFEPQRGAVMTDIAFNNAISAVSANGQIRWGAEHLYYEVCRRLRRKMLRLSGCIWVCLVLGGVLLSTALASKNFLVGIAALIVGAITLSLIRRRLKKTVPLTAEKFNEMWSRWVKVHGTPAGLIVRQEPPARSRRVEADIGDYSFDRAVICDRARTVDLLLANNFHFENNCAVLAIGGYPQGPFETVRAMLKRNPRLQVFVLHDASPAGCKTVYHLVNDPEWFKGHTATIVDVGLRPVHAKPFEGLLIKNQRNVVLPAEGITTEEAEWLSTYTL